jgi:Trk-type K+ transport system membrane component
MRWLRRPDVWLPLVLIASTVLGGWLLSTQACVRLSERDRTAYGSRPSRQADFDALSAVCGCGLLTYDLDEDYTPLGRWVLLGLGVTGALCYLAAIRQVAGRLWKGAGPLPSLCMILAAYAALQLLAILAVWTREGATGADWQDAVVRAVSAFSSLGWFRMPAENGANWVYAAVAFGGGLGWTIWLAMIPRARVLAWRTGFVLVATYVAFLLVSGGLIAALESPRGTPRARESAREQAAVQRFERGVVQVTCAAGAGIATEELHSREASEGTKAVLAGAMLVGGVGGSAGGGATWAMLAWVLAYGWATGNGSGRLGRAAAACLLWLVGLTVVTALGLLLIETHVGSRFQSPPTFADALLDASSAVNGGALTSGLLASVTSANLSSGIRQSVDLYQYGMTWLMLAMFIGRIVPVLVLARYARRDNEIGPDRLPPLA